MTRIAAHPRFPDASATLPRFQRAGHLTLDLFHRDGRVDDRWLGLNPLEFALLWRLAEQPGTPVSRQHLLWDVWGLASDPGSNSLAVHVARARSKLDRCGLRPLLQTGSDGSYFLDPGHSD